MIRMTNKLFLTLLTVFLMVHCTRESESEPSDMPEEAYVEEVEIQALKVETLLRDSLGLAPDVEVIVSYVEIPKNTTLPAHYHPGEEFVYTLKGSGELTLEGETKTIVKAGDLVKIPLRHIHSFSTIDQDVTVIVFRVHEKGQPERILVE